jgi:hypothetical protein
MAIPKKVPTFYFSQYFGHSISNLIITHCINLLATAVASSIMSERVEVHNFNLTSLLEHYKLETIG